MADAPVSKTTLQQLEEIQLKTALMNMKIAERQLEAFENKERSNATQKKQRQADLHKRVTARAAMASKCSHRQGASPKNVYKGAKGADTTLKVVRMPDGFTTLIHCPICRLAVFSPHPYDRNPKPQKHWQTGVMETKVEAKARAEKWEADAERFAELMEDSQDAKSVDFTTPMDCGNKFIVRDEEGQQVLKRRPSDSYPQATPIDSKRKKPATRAA